MHARGGSGLGVDARDCGSGVRGFATPQEAVFAIAQLSYPFEVKAVDTVVVIYADYRERHRTLPRMLSIDASACALVDDSKHDHVVDLIPVDLHAIAAGVAKLNPAWSEPGRLIRWCRGGS